MHLKNDFQSNAPHKKSSDQDLVDETFLKYSRSIDEIENTAKFINSWKNLFDINFDRCLIFEEIKHVNIYKLVSQSIIYFHLSTNNF